MGTDANPLVHWLALRVSRLFYRIDLVGAVPPTGAAILLANHSNALLDAAVVWAMAGRPVRFLAKSTLFDGPLRPLLAGARSIPVYRRRDEGVDTSRNTEMFAAVQLALARGDAICLFPEGISHSSGRLAPLRTGAARIALAAEREGTSVALVPVGLNFDRKATFRSRVTVVFGPPFACRDLLPSAEQEDREAVRALTDRITEHLRRLLIEADPQADAALVDRVDQLYAAARERPRDPEERVARRRVIASGIERLRQAAPERYDSILLELRRYDERLARLGLRDRHLDWKVTSGEAAAFVARELSFALVLAPLALLGLALFFVPYQLTGLLAHRVIRERDLLATAQVLGGALVYGAWLTLAVLAAWWLGGRAVGFVSLLSLPLLAIGALFAIERESAVLDAVRAWFLLRRARAETRAQLARRRSELAQVLDEVHVWLSSGEGS